MDHVASAGCEVGGEVVMRAGAHVGGPAMTSIYRIECFAPDGTLKWVEEVKNLVVTQGLNDLLDKYFKGAAYTAGFFVGLKGTGAIAAGDTMAAHAGWAEITAYSNAARPGLTLGAVAAGSVDNAASKAAFNINGAATVAGAFVTTVNTKGGTTGVLYGAADFAAARTVAADDTLNVQVTLTAASA